MVLVIAFASCQKDDYITPDMQQDTHNSRTPHKSQTQEASCDFIGFKYYSGTQDTLGELENNYILLGIDSIYSDNQIRNFISTISEFDQNYDYNINKSNYKYKEIPLRLDTAKTCEQITQLISDLEQYAIVSYAHYTIKTDNCLNLIWEPIGDLCVLCYTSNFYVKVFDENDLTDLSQTMAETNTELVQPITSLPGWYVLRATKHSNGDALQMANYFFETGLFKYSEPSITKYPVE